MANVTKNSHSMMLLKGSGENDMLFIIVESRTETWGNKIGIFLKRDVDDLYLTTSQLFLLKQDLSSNGDLSN